jgi:hypothetical protein
LINFMGGWATPLEDFIKCLQNLKKPHCVCNRLQFSKRLPEMLGFTWVQSVSLCFNFAISETQLFSLSFVHRIIRF